MEAFSLVRFLPAVRVADGFMLKNYLEGQAPVIMDKKNDTTEDVKILLNTIFPPREFEHEGEIWRQNVSTVCTDRSGEYKVINIFCFHFRQDVKELISLMDQKLEQRQARQTGICQVQLVRAIEFDYDF